MAVGVGVGLIVEWLWHPMDRLLTKALRGVWRERAEGRY